MFKNLLFFVLLLTTPFLSAQNIDPQKLNDEISVLNDQFKYEASLLRLEEVITDKKSTYYDIFNAYIQRSLTYKRLYNYPEVARNLELAKEHLDEVNDNKLKEIGEVRLLVEQLFVAFDNQKWEDVDKVLKEISTKDLSLLNSETQLFYYNVIATLQMREKDFVNAEKTLNHAIELGKIDNPKHVAAVYIKLIDLAEFKKDTQMAEKAFDNAIFYSKKYKMLIYEKFVYYIMSQFYAEIKDFEKAYYYQKIAVELTYKYSTNTFNGKLTILDKNLLDKRKNIEIDYEKKIRYLLITCLIAVVAFLVVVIKLYNSNKEKNRFIQRENNRMRIELENFMKESHEKGEHLLRIEDYNLTERQLEIIELVKQGKTNKEIGKELFISENTVKYHLKIIYKALGIDNRLGLKF
ncbi:LuxR C-terminal-related transcriptional regulator [Empedobacter falsenii]|uniref:Response regulator transcription factor n=1 Tax=Empedobacter falsenii TaxID=343874 RepID=A0AAW7DLY3_9FLAO|nr:LuxR C-terminal-related transcriptional regulator [Empedobacter falsenii]MDM1551942.1 response regulator transcription factor [Empedobacter falsenii]